MLLAIGLRGASAEQVASPSRPVCESSPPRRYEGRTIEEWREVIKSLELTSRAAAQAVPGLIALCRDPAVPEQTRIQAAYLLGRIGAAAEPAVPVLIELLRPPGDQDTAPTARWAAKALALFGARAADATPALVIVAADSDRTILARLSATEALGRIGGAHPEAIPVLIQLASANAPATSSAFESQQVQAAAIDSLALVGSAASAAVPSLIQLTRAEAAHLRRRAAATLGAIGPPAGIASGALVDLVLFDDRAEVRDAAAAALAAIGEPGAAALRQLLIDQDVEVRRSAVSAFEGVERLTDASRQALVTALKDPDIDVRLSAVKTLHNADHDAEPLIPVLLAALTDDDRQPRIRAYRILIEMPGQAAALLPHLRELADDPRPHVRQVANKAIEQLTQPETDN